MNTFIKGTKEFDNSLELVYNMINHSVNDKLRLNYTKKRLRVNEWDAVSVFDGGFSSVSWRPYWNNNCRILNRFFKKPEYRFENKSLRVSQETLDMIEQQLEVARILGYDCAFMSRETKTQAFHHYKRFLPQQWYTDEKRYRMTEDDYQHVMWTSINNNAHLDMEFEA